MPETPSRAVVVNYGALRIPVLLEFRERKRLSISVHPDCTVTALAPSGRSLQQVVAQIERRGPWIARQLRYFEAYQPLPERKHFVAGETHLYLGRQYRLRVRRAEKESVKLRGGYLNVSVCAPKEARRVRLALEEWYRSHAESIYRDRLVRCLEAAPSLRRRAPTMRIRQMNGRWGSCSKAGTITLSTELVKAPVHCIEYVIMHEVCHLVVHDHSPAFFRLLSRSMPDWEGRKARLGSVALR